MKDLLSSQVSGAVFGLRSIDDNAIVKSPAGFLHLAYSGAKVVFPADGMSDKRYALSVLPEMFPRPCPHNDSHYHPRCPASRRDGSRRISSMACCTSTARLTISSTASPRIPD